MSKIPAALYDRMGSYRQGRHLITESCLLGNNSAGVLAAASRFLELKGESKPVPAEHVSPIQGWWVCHLVEVRKA
jgi:hypothetical protein